MLVEAEPFLFAPPRLRSFFHRKILTHHQQSKQGIECDSACMLEARLPQITSGAVA
jgi:hypothetical protein